MEGAITAAFNAAGAGGIEGIASGSARELFRHTMRQSVTSAWLAGAKEFARGTLGEVGEEVLIEALDNAFVQMSLRPDMTIAEFFKKLHDTALVTTFASAPSSAVHGVNAVRDVMGMGSGIAQADGSVQRVMEADGNAASSDNGKRPNPFKDEAGNWKFTAEEIQNIDDRAFAQTNRRRIVNTDDVRSLIPGYDQANPLTRDDDVQGLASAVNSRVLERMLAEPVTVGRVIILAGGGGSGKSTVSLRFAPDADFTIDTTFSNPASADQLIARIRATGREPEVLYVHRRFSLAMENILSRYLTEKHETNTGRIVPVNVAAAAHIGAQETILSRTGIPVRIIGNNGKIENIALISLEKLAEDRYISNHEPRSQKAIHISGSGRRGSDAGTQRSSTGSGEDQSYSGRIEAEARLRSEGERIIREFREAGLLTEAEADAFLAR
jgi:hypothetical protein